MNQTFEACLENIRTGYKTLMAMKELLFKIQIKSYDQYQVRWFSIVCKHYKVFVSRAHESVLYDGKVSHQANYLINSLDHRLSRDVNLPITPQNNNKLYWELPSVT